MIKKLKRFLRKSYNNISWLKDVYTAPTPYSKENLKEIDTCTLENCLILAPHADDEWIGCSQIIRKAKQCSVYYFQFLGKNYNDDNKRVRHSELTKLCKKFNIQLISSTNYEDYSDLVQLLKENQYSHILLPFPIDWHNEHIEVNYILNNILSDALNNKLTEIDYSKTKIIFYNISIPLPHLSIEFLPINKKDLKQKRKVFYETYYSQYGTSVRRMTLQNRLSAKGTHHYAIEPYSNISIDEWKMLLPFVNEHLSELKEMAHSIDNMQRIRMLTNNIYQKFLAKNNK